VFETRILRTTTEAGSRRREPRDSLFLSAIVRRESDGDAELQPVRVRNLSGVGLMADYCDVVEPGEAVVVTLRGVGSVAGRVAWVKKNRVGIAFDVEVNPRLARKPVVPPPAAPLLHRPL
jgi:hypothetical protein